VSAVLEKHESRSTTSDVGVRMASRRNGRICAVQGKNCVDSLVHCRRLSTIPILITTNLVLGRGAGYHDLTRLSEGRSALESGESSVHDPAAHPLWLVCNRQNPPEVHETIYFGDEKEDVSGMTEFECMTKQILDRGHDGTGM
jgi:hypothetical protein